VTCRRFENLKNMSGISDVQQSQLLSAAAGSIAHILSCRLSAEDRKSRVVGIAMGMVLDDIR
jgi:hypothetical protein